MKDALVAGRSSCKFANLTTLRHFAVNLLKLEKTNKLGVANKRNNSGWDRDSLLQVLSGAPA